MKDVCVECNNEFDLKHLVPYYSTELKNGDGELIWTCKECYSKLNSPTSITSAYLYYPGIKNAAYTPLNLIEDVCVYFGIDKDKVKQKGRERGNVFERQICMYFIKEKFANLRLREIGEMFLKDHALVIHSHRAVQNGVDTDPKYRKIIKDLSAIIDHNISLKNRVAEVKQ